MTCRNDVSGILCNLALTIGVLASAGAAAQPLRELCPTRPGLGTAPCIVDKGHAIAELGLVDWTVENSSASRGDTVLIGDFLVRYGLTDRSEIQLGWTALGHARERDKATGTIASKAGIGDLTVALKHSLRSPGGNGLSIAMQPFVTLPLGGSAIGGGDWGGGLLLPASIDLTDRLQFQLTPSIEARVDGDRSGRHFAFGGVAGVGMALSDELGITVEASVLRDHDPAGHATELLAGVSIAWQPSANIQLDAGTSLGLNHASPDAALAIGISKRF